MEITENKVTSREVKATEWGFKSYYTANNDIRWIDLVNFTISMNETNIVSLDTLLRTYNINS